MKDSKDGTSAKLKRFVDDPASCDASKGESVVEWVTEGPEGTNGDSGPQGPAGAGAENLGFARTAASVGNVGVEGSLAIGADGLPIASHFDGVPNNDLVVTHCGNTACSSGNTTQTVDSTNDVGRFSSIAIGADRLPVVSYYDVTSQDLKVTHCTSVTCSTFDTPQTVDGGGTVGLYSSIAIGTDGLPVVSYRAASSEFDLKVAHCNDPACDPAVNGAETLATVDNAGNVGEHTSIAIGSDGFPVVSYTDGTLVDDADLKVFHCTSVDCTTVGGLATPVDTTGNVGLFTSIAIGTDSYPVVSYYDATNTSLKVAHCTDASCSTFDVPTTVDNTGTLGFDSSIAIGADGLPVVSYRDLNGGDDNLKVARCGNTACSLGNRAQTVEATGDLGLNTSIAIGVDGLPIVSHWDDLNGDLRVAHCSNRFCIPFHRSR